MILTKHNFNFVVPFWGEIGWERKRIYHKPKGKRDENESREKDGKKGWLFGSNHLLTLTVPTVFKVSTTKK